MRKFIIIILLISALFIITGCHPCNNRSLEKDDIEEYAREYGLEDYKQEFVSFTDIETTAELYGYENVYVTPEQRHMMIVEHKEHTLKLLFLTACLSNDIYYIEEEFPQIDEILNQVELYNNENEFKIEILENIDIPIIEFRYDYNKVNLSSNITFFIGVIPNGESNSGVIVATLGNNSFALIKRTNSEYKILKEFSID